MGVFEENAIGVRQRDLFEELPRPSMGLRPRKRRVRRQRLENMAPDRLDRIERCRWLLKHHRHLASPNVAPLLLVERKEISPTVRHRSREPAPLGQQVHQGPRRERLAAATLAHDGQGLARVKIEVDPVDGGKEASANRNLDLQAADGQQRRSHRLSGNRFIGSSVHRSIG